MKKAAVYSLVTIWLIGVLGVSAWAAWDPMQEQKERAAVEETIAKFKEADSSIHCLSGNR
jgi:predicted negative regulator of RcsB-dependent stress response